MKYLVICLACPQTSPRPNRLIQFLANRSHSVDLISPKCDFGNSFVRHIHHLERPSTSIFRRILTRFIRVLFSPLIRLRFLQNTLLVIAEHVELYSYPAINFDAYDYIILENFELLKFCFQSLKSNTSRLVLDARESYLHEFDSSWYFRHFIGPYRKLVASKYLIKFDTIFSVSPSIVRAYQKSTSAHVALLRSTPFYRNISPSIVDFNNIKMVHHGTANTDRNLANLILIAKTLPQNFSLDLYLTGSKSSILELKKIAALSDNIRVLPPVPYNDIIPMLNNYDIGLYYLEPSSFNLRHCLPNKFFEFIQARLAVAIGPSPDMLDIVNKYQCGFVSDEFTVTSMVERLSTLDINMIIKAKQNSNLAANDLCYEREGHVLSVNINA